MEIKLVVYRTPVRAGSCYVFYNNITRGASPDFKAKAAANKRPPLETHLSMLRFFVGFNYCGLRTGGLHCQQTALHK